MVKKFISVIIIILLSCITLYATDSYSDEKSIINDMISIMETYNKSIEASICSEDFVKANNVFAEQIVIHTPKMNTIIEKHPEWGNNPPEELLPLLQMYTQVCEKAFTQSLPKAIQFSNEHMDESSLQDSLMNITHALGTMQGKQ